MLPPGTSIRWETRFAVILIPIFVLGAFGFGTYAVVPHLCIDYLYRDKKRHAAAIVLLVLYFLFFILSFATYLRTCYTTQFNPGFAPLPAERELSEKGLEPKTKRLRARDVEDQPWVPPDENVDSPGLESFYSKEIFVCDFDGRPKWCSDCRAWKPDRTHHSSDLGRCVRKLDHVCPWVAGAVSETSFNFFVQFTFYCTLYCIICISAAAYSLKLQLADGKPLDGRIIAVIVLAGFLGLFTLGMVSVSLRFVFKNITNIDMLKTDQFFRLAVRVPLHTPETQGYRTVTYPLRRPDEGPPSNVPNGTATAVAMRDQQAMKTFAVLQTESGENPWDLGYWQNWKSVMGNSPLAWLLPIWHSPCCNHESMESDYKLGPLLQELKKRYSVHEIGNAGPNGIELGITGMTNQ